jgi:3-deoxy-7-phosphoheptulonate synthase
VIIDASHANSGKDPQLQPHVVREVAQRLSAGESGIVGIMLESFLVEGNQTFTVGRASDLVYGQSITDGCIGWPATVDVLGQLAQAIARRRRP